MQIVFETAGTHQVAVTAYEPGVYELTLQRIGDVPQPPLPPQPSGGYARGELPADGWLGSTTGSGYRFRPALRDGQRLSGMVTVLPVAGAPAVLYRLLVDGVPQPTNTIDTMQWPDGTHVLAFQVLDHSGQTAHNGSRVVVFNNSGEPIRSKEGQAIVALAWNPPQSPQNSLAWGRVDVLDPQPYPLDPQLDRHPVAQTDEDRQRLATEKLWWVEGITHQPMPLWQTMPVLMQNRDGDWFIKQFNPQGGGAGVTPLNALPYVERAPAYDGPRGVGWLNPYASLNPHPHVLASGQTGWVGVEKSGRVVWLDITGEITTILGPRSVAGVPGTDCDDMAVTLEMRLTFGEKEYVGDPNGQALKMPHDIWPCDSFPHEGVIADTGHDQVREIDFGIPKAPGDPPRMPRLMRRWPIKGVTSVCSSPELQRQLHIAWVAAAPDGLWLQRVEATEDLKAFPDAPIGPDGKVIAHLPPVRVADIPRAFWVRVLGTRVFVFTADLGIYEYDATTGAVTERLARKAKAETYVFASVDVNGAIGPVGRIYWGSASAKNGGYGSSKTSIYTFDPDTGATGWIDKTKVINRAIYGNWTATTDPLGHYMWGVAIHATLPKFLACGITSSSWFLWTGCLGELPKPDPVIPYTGTKEWRYGVLDETLPPAAVWGYHGHGGIGYSCDQFRQFKTWEEAQSNITKALEPFFSPSWDDAQREAVAKQLFAQRTRNRF